MHIISVACLGFLTLYFLVDSLAQRTMVETMKMVAKPARAVMAMRQGFTIPRVKQCWSSAVAGHFEVFVVWFGSCLVTRWMKIPGALVELTAAAAAVVLAVAFEIEMGSAVALGLLVSAKCDVDSGLVFAKTGRDVAESFGLLVDI